MNWLIYLLGTIISYLTGSINPALIVSKILKKDITKGGSKNLGASNVTITLGPKWGILVGAFDIFKGFILVFLARIIFKDLTCLPFVLGSAAILGHIFPFYHKFKGGKGFATLIGCILGYNIIAFIVTIVLIAVITLSFDYIAIATVTISVSYPIFVGIYTHNPINSVIVAASTIVIIIKHIENFIKISKKEEIGIRSALTKKNRL